MELPLSTCYRCPKSHIKLVRSIFPDIPIKAFSKNKEGNIEYISDRQLEDKDFLVTGDLLLGRRTSPLVKLCIRLISKGVSATVKGRAIGELLKSELREVAKVKPFEYKNFRSATERYREKKLEKWRYKENLDQLLEGFSDRLAALIAIYESQINANSIKDLETYIDTLFSDSISPVTLSTLLFIELRD
jgi:DNA helicase II / ATP-dependent DNA helicase PcrA